MVRSLFPCNPKDPVPGFVAQRVIEDRELGDYKHDIATRYRISPTAVNAILDHYRRTGEIREQHPGRGKKSDPRWILAGEEGPGRLTELERSRDRLLDDELLLESYQTALREGSDGLQGLSHSTYCAAMRDKLCYTSKLLTAYAQERDAENCDAWFEAVNYDFTPEMLVLADETNSDNKVRYCHGYC
jgi:hypothetical protein